MSYSSLHNHTMYSLLDGFSTPKEYLDRARELGLKAFAVTEHGNMYSFVYFDKLKNDYPEIKILYGVELYECFDMKVKDKDSKYFHLIALAKNEKGRIALNEIVTKSNFEGFYFKPRVDLELLKPYGEDLVISSACLGSKLAREKDYITCLNYVKEYKEIFPHFYLEMQSHTSKDQIEYNKKILQLSKDTNTPYIITTDSHSATKEDLYYQQRHVQIAQDRETMNECYEGCYMLSEDEIIEAMSPYMTLEQIKIGLENTNKIADLIDEVNMPFQEPQLPSYPLPKGFENDTDYLKYLVEQGWKQRRIYNMTEEEQKIRRDRIDYELDVIAKMGFDGYFIIVWDFINWARENNIRVGDGRGSGAGSLVCYMLGITNLDPIKYGLIFERFLNIERISMPDLDIDLSDRGKVIEYLTQKYGEENVCQIINFSYITPVVAIKDVGKVLKIPYKITDKISKRFSYDTFEECMKNNPNILEECQREYDEEMFEKIQEMFKIASKISGKVRQVSCHAGGVGITDNKITDYMAMKLGSKGEHVIQVDKKIIEEIGIIKFDLLGVQTLSLVQEVVDEVRIKNFDIDINNPKFETDELAYELLSEANTMSVFQVESQGMRDLLLRLKPQNMEELSAVIALYRPDSMGALEDFIKYKNNPSEIKYIHEDMKSILEMTYGCMIYQEQLLDIVRKFGGRTYGGADKFRKGIGRFCRVI